MSGNATLPVYTHPVFRRHEHPDGAFDLPSHELLAVDEPHPDRPCRVRNVEHAIRTALGGIAEWPDVREATRDELERVHEPEYLDEIDSIAAAGGGRIAATTGVSAATPRAVRTAAGTSIAAAERAVRSDPDTVPYALVRPSGHHAQPAQADGYCLVNNVAVAAEHLIANGLADRVAILDWDVHPGNGTQEVFYDREDVLFVSLHSDYGAWGPTHPQSSDLTEHGRGDGTGYTVQIPLPPGTGDEGYEAAFERLVCPIVDAYGADVLLVSAGQDGGQMDPNGRNLLTMDGFRTLGRYARSLGDGRVALIQEGGYHVSHLAFCTLGVLEGAVGVATDMTDPYDLLESHNPAVEDWLDEAVDLYKTWWPVA